MRPIVLATRNSAKLREIREVLSELPVDVASLDHLPPGDEPAETGQTFAENACQKAHWYARATSQWCLADDSGLQVDALSGRPGVRTARYAADRCRPGASKDEIGQANNRKLLETLRDIPTERRTAQFVCCLALSDGHNILTEATGVIAGRIAHQARGANGFGYDPLFIPNGMDCTMAELSAEQKNAISHRGQAVRRFATDLKVLLSGRPPTAK